MLLTFKAFFHDCCWSFFCVFSCLNCLVGVATLKVKKKCKKSKERLSLEVVEHFRAFSPILQNHLIRYVRVLNNFINFWDQTIQYLKGYIHLRISKNYLQTFFNLVQWVIQFSTGFSRNGVVFESEREISPKRLERSTGIFTRPS